MTELAAVAASRYKAGMIADMLSVTSESGPQDALERLARALIASVALHAILLAWPTPHPRAGRMSVAGPPLPLLVQITHNVTESVTPPLPPPAPVPVPVPVPDAPVSVGPKVGADDTPLAQKARFASPPDFSVAEAVPLLRPIHLKLRIHVTPQGRAGRMEIVESLLVPPDFLVAVSEAVQAAQFLPGEAGGRPVDSSFDLVIDASPPAVTGGAGVIVGPR